MHCHRNFATLPEVEGDGTDGGKLGSAVELGDLENMDTPEGLRVNERIRLNTILWARSLPDEELGPSNRMIEDLEALKPVGGLDIEVVSLSTKEAMLAFLADLAIRSHSGLRPLLHFDCHGSIDGLMMESGELLTWDELVDPLRKINVATHSNLVCVLAACFGLHFLKTLRLSEPSPWYVLIAPETEVTLDVLEARTRPFYEHLIKSSNINEAFRISFEPELRLYNCQVLFAKGLATYVLDHASGKELRLRTERLVTESLRVTQAAGTPIPLRVARKLIKHQLKPGQDLIDKFAPIFLVGRKPAISFRHLKRVMHAERGREAGPLPSRSFP